MADLVDIDEAKAFVGFNADADDEDLFAAAHAAGQKVVRDWLGWDPLVQDRVDTVNGTGAPSIPLSAAPVISLASVHVGTIPLDVTKMITQGRMLIRKDGTFPRGTANVFVTYRAGIARTELAPVFVATRLAIKAVWSAFRLDPNFAYHQEAGVESASFYADGPGALPPAAKVHLQPYRRVYVP